MPEPDETRLRHMLDAAHSIMSSAEERSLEELYSDRELRWVLERGLAIVGEAAARLSKTCRQRFPDVPWEQIIALRNRLVHDYDNIDPSIIWSVVRTHLPELVSQIAPFVSGATTGQSNGQGLPSD